MTKSLLYFRSALSYALIGLLGLICFPPCLVVMCLPARYRYDNKLFFWFANLFYKGVLRALCVPIEISGQEYLPQQAAIFVANHQSSLDIPLVGSLCNGYPHIWLVLDYYATHPFLGIFVRRMNITVNRDSPAKAAETLLRTIKMVKDKQRHLLIFPEGGRFTDGRIHAFFEGFALIAKKTGHPVIPVYIENNYKIFPPGGWVAYPYPVKAYIGEPFVYGPSDTPQLFTQRVYSWFVQQSTAEH